MEDKKHLREEEVLSDEQTPSEGEKAEESACSSWQDLAISRKVTALVVPAVEALIIGRKIREDSSVDVTLIVAPYIKKGVWLKVFTYIRNSQKIYKKILDSYIYKLPWFEKLAKEAIRNKGEPEWIRQTLEDINSLHKEGTRMRSCTAKEREVFKNKREHSSEAFELSEEDNDVKDLRDSSRRSSKAHETRMWSSESKESGSNSPRRLGKKKKAKKPVRSIWGSSAKEKRAARKACQVSSSDSRRSSQESLGDEEVWDSEEDQSGLVFCPFSSKDVRRYIDVKATIRGRVTEKKFVRQTLQNLYTHYTNLQSFIDYIQSKSHHSQIKPFPSDLVWLEHHAIYIDTLLFESLKGTWGLWNEPLLDILVRAFLELVVRCTPRRQYPDKLEERVRRWMKKNHVGICSSYGSVPSYLQNAKLSEKGVVFTNNQSIQYSRGRGSSEVRGSFRGRGISSFGNRRGGTKSDRQDNSHE